MVLILKPESCRICMIYALVWTHKSFCVYVLYMCFTCALIFRGEESTTESTTESTMVIEVYYESIKVSLLFSAV